MKRTKQDQLFHAEAVIMYYHKVCYSLDIWQEHKYYRINVVMDKCYNKYGDYVGLCDHDKKEITIYLGDNDIADVFQIVRHEARHVWQRYNWSRKLRYYDNRKNTYEKSIQEIDAYAYAEYKYLENNIYDI